MPSLERIRPKILGMPWLKEILFETEGWQINLNLTNCIVPTAFGHGPVSALPTGISVRDRGST
jgi:hypothetical protein